MKNQELSSLGEMAQKLKIPIKKNAIPNLPKYIYLGKL
jgi:hypothetical protein